jgi:ribosome-binding protein aMBF1 (putative translation factor)
MPRGDDLDAFIARRTARNPGFPKLLEAAHETRRLVRELAAERERQGLSQERVAAELGTKQPNIARLERGAVDPKHTTLVRYARLLGRNITLEPIEHRGRKQTRRSADTQSSN